ncbi:putative enzyme related to lactoylglutathione lyase [Rubricella aquisinus]|uniref:Putative enzyme related to lactoylglutathione lyase n=1 Tax=Rubricella aquisinus TaxID=2028108 RepID=A0A840WXW9_9RHOB|nr:VOC family protein [Rubricella aquisinus]MBB5514515.1 putative enzyme related to lactoylglutathione lyase [Rubricella aquisinus]
MAQRPEGDVQLTITFWYYKDLARAEAFYRDVMGFTLAIDQGWAKIMHIGGGAHVGLVDETKGMHNSEPIKPVQLCIRVPDVDAWYAYVQEVGVDGLSELFVNDEIGIRAFVFNDPEGWQIEVQTATRPGA